MNGEDVEEGTERRKVWKMGRRVRAWRMERRRTERIRDAEGDRGWGWEKNEFVL